MRKRRLRPCLVGFKLALLQQQAVIRQGCQHAVGLDLVADIGFERLDRQSVDQGLHVDFLDGPDRAGRDDLVDQRPGLGLGHDDCGQVLRWCCGGCLLG
ncbi:hypothetical protein D3C87_1823820 [compost metagenome]